MLSEIVTALRVWADSAGGVGVFVVAFLDSSFLALPNATDGLVMYLSIQRPSLWWYYVTAAVAGTILGSLPLYLLGRRGGMTLVERRFSGPRAARALAWYVRGAFVAVMLPAFLPPPAPLKIFVVLAGATALRPWRLVLAIALGRGARHLVEALVALRYREQAVQLFERHGATVAMVVVAGVALLALAVFAWPARAQPEIRSAR